MKKAKPVILAWLARSQAYGGQLSSAEKVLARLKKSAESLFLDSEIHCFRGNHLQALEAIERGIDLKRDTHLFPGERVSWENGFAALEERCFLLKTQGGVLMRLMRAFRAFLLGLNDRQEEASRELRRITREERISSIDPYWSFYHFFYSRVLSEDAGSTSEGDHKLTILNKAVKYFQERSNRIESADLRRKYSTANRWNAELLKDGKRWRLI